MARVTPLPPMPRDEIELVERRRLCMGELIGRGSSSSVHRAVLESGRRLRRTVAVKLFDFISTDERDTVLPRIERAVRHAACIQHPNAVEVYELGVLGGSQPFVVSEVVEGRSLAGLLEAFAQQRQRLPLDLALFIGTEVAEGLLGANLALTPDGRQIGVTHGDLSPRDVLLSWFGEVKVSDFGIARAVGAASTVQRIAKLARRAASIAPEVAHGVRGDARSDVFSLGVLLHEMLVGPRFPPGVAERETLELARRGYVHTSLFAPHLPESVRDILRRATVLDPAERHPHAGAVAYELRRAAMEMGVGDGRLFLRHALQQMLEDTILDTNSDERPVASVRARAITERMELRKTVEGED